MSTKRLSLSINKKISSFNKIINVDSDKSISIRSFLIGSISQNISSVSNVLESDDVLSTIKCLKKLGVNAPIIVLPRGINKGIVEYTNNVNLDVLSVDYQIDIKWALDNIDSNIVLQGNLDPTIIKKGGQDLENEVNALVEATKGRRHIFCSGHGLLPDTPIKNIEKWQDE